MGFKEGRQNQSYGNMSVSLERVVDVWWVMNFTVCFDVVCACFSFRGRGSCSICTAAVISRSGGRARKVAGRRGRCLFDVGILFTLACLIYGVGQVCPVTFYVFFLLHHSSVFRQDPLSHELKDRTLRSPFKFL